MMLSSPPHLPQQRLRTQGREGWVEWDREHGCRMPSRSQTPTPSSLPKSYHRDYTVQHHPSLGPPPSQHLHYLHFQAEDTLRYNEKSKHRTRQTWVQSPKSSDNTLSDNIPAGLQQFQVMTIVPLSSLIGHSFTSPKKANLNNKIYGYAKISKKSLVGIIRKSSFKRWHLKLTFFNRWMGFARQRRE